MSSPESYVPFSQPRNLEKFNSFPQDPSAEFVVKFLLH